MPYSLGWRKAEGSITETNAPITKIRHLKLLKDRRYRRQMHVRLVSLAARGIDPSHIHIVCAGSRSCCEIEHVHMTYVRIITAMQMDGVPVLLVHEDGSPCEHNIEEMAG